ncbi:MAG: COG3014 family protein [Pseudomonas shirazensis]
MVPRAVLLAALIAVTQLTGCAVFRSYDSELQETNQQLVAGNVDAALALLESNNKSDVKDLLYYFEKGELLRSKGDLQGSQQAWRVADGVVFEWEEAVKLDTEKYLSQFASYLVNDKVRRYQGYDYEKVMLTTQMALNLLAQNDFAGARTEIKKTHEREAVIAELRDKQYLKGEQEAEQQGASTEFKDLKGYPVASLDDPEVVSLKNSYQSAFSHYLSGFVYEALGEKGLAAPGYRTAAELRPKTPLLEQALLNLDGKQAKAGESDVLIVVQSGLAPARDSMRIPLPLTIDGNLVITTLSFPVIREDNSTARFAEVYLNDQAVSLTSLNNTSAMSRRALRDDMPEIILRTSVRAVSRTLAQKKLNEVDPLAALIVGIAAAVVEGADTRTWRTLPNQTQVARVHLAQGEHRLSLPAILGSGTLKVKIDQPYQVISLRVLGHQVFASGAAIQLPQPAQAPVLANLK